MQDWQWIAVVIGLFAIIVYGAYMLGRYSALAERTRPAGPDDERAAPQPRDLPRSAASAPPASAGGVRDTGVRDTGATPVKPRSAAPPPASAGGGGSGGDTSPRAPDRGVKPPPAQAAWSSDKPRK